MEFKIIISPREDRKPTSILNISPKDDKKPNDVLVDIITSAAFFNRKKIRIWQDEDMLAFIIRGYCPREYLSYLARGYNVSLEYIERNR